MKRLFIITVILMLLLQTVQVIAQSPSTNYDVQRKRSTSKEQSVQEKKGIEFKESRLSRTSSSLGKSYSVEISIDPIILAELAKYELNTEPFSVCRLITLPPLPKDFGISAEVDKGLVDLYMAEYLQKAGQFNMSVKGIVRTEKLKQYAICLALYSDIVASVLERIQNTYLNVDVLKRHISNTVGELVKKKPDTRILKQISSLDFDRCRFAGDYTRIQCGQLYIEISEQPKMTLSKSVIYSPPVFMNISAKFNISRAAVNELAHVIDTSKKEISETGSLVKEKMETSNTIGIKNQPDRR